MRVPENLRIFTLLSVIYSVFYFFVMYRHMQDQCWWAVTLVSLVFVFLVLFSAGRLGRDTDASGMKTNKWYAYHLSAYITVNLVHALFFVFDWVSADATIISVIGTAVVWGILLALHGYAVGRRRAKEAGAS